MRRNVVAVVVFLWACSCFAQSTEAPDPDKPALDRLMSLTVLPQPEWRYSADVAHPEDASLSDADWPVVKAREEWKSGARVLRRWIEIPEQIDGYSTLDARVKLDLFFVSNERLVISVFSNGSLVARGDYDSQQPVLLTEKAQPGQKFLIAVRVDALEVDTQIYHSQLHIEPPATRVNPEMLGTEILAARPLIAAFPAGKAERENTIDAALKAIDFAALDRGDQRAFDASLRQAQSKLETLKPWLQKFTIHAVGNSHIDMAWLWPCQKARVGGTKNPDLGRVTELRPDLVIVNTDENRLATAQELEALGLKILVTQTDSLDQVEATWTQLGEATGKRALVASERVRISRTRERNRQRLQNEPRLRALIMVWKSPWMASGSGTYMESLLESCGIDKVLANIKTKWIRVALTAKPLAEDYTTVSKPTYSLPLIPDVVFLPTEPFTFTETHRDDFAHLLPRERVHVVDGELLSWWLSRTVEGLEYFYQLHQRLTAQVSHADDSSL